MIEFDGAQFTLPNGVRVVCPHRIEDVRMCGNIAVVLFDGRDAPIKGVRFANLFGYDGRGNELWVAEMPISGSATEYMLIESVEPLVVLSLSSYRCTIDPNTGRITRREFLK